MISASGTGKLEIVKDNLNKVGYRDIIDSRLLPQLLKVLKIISTFVNVSQDNNYIFMHCGAPCHEVKGVKTHRDDRFIIVLYWPGNRSDINPIEC